MSKKLAPKDNRNCQIFMQKHRFVIGIVIDNIYEVRIPQKAVTNVRMTVVVLDKNGFVNSYIFVVRR